MVTHSLVCGLQVVNYCACYCIRDVYSDVTNNGSRADIIVFPRGRRFSAKGSSDRRARMWLYIAIGAATLCDGHGASLFIEKNSGQLKDILGFLFLLNKLIEGLIKCNCLIPRSPGLNVWELVSCVNSKRPSCVYASCVAGASKIELLSSRAVKKDVDSFDFRAD